MRRSRHNWGRSHSWFPSEFAYPGTLQELREVIASAKQRRLTVRSVGSLHSLNRLCATLDLQLHTDRLCGILHIDRERLTVKVQGGIKIKHLLTALAERGLALPNQGYIVEQSVAGAIGTATHGSGQTGTLSSFVTELELVTASGELLTLSPQSDAHLFSAAVVHLGCLGVIYSVTLQCVPLRRLELSKLPGTVSALWSELPHLLQDNNFFQVVIDPYSDALFSWRYRYTDAPYARRWRYQAQRQLIHVMAVTMMDLVWPPSWTMSYLLKFYMMLSPLKHCVDDSYRLLSPADEGHYIEQEIAVPSQHLEPALACVRSIVDEFSARSVRVVAIILVRFAEADAYGYLSPTLQRPTAYISLITLRKPGYVELFQEVEQALYIFQGRPHWGKVHFLTRHQTALLYLDTYEPFCRARHQLDPQGLFANRTIRELF